MIIVIIALKFSRSIGHVYVELKTDISEISSVFALMMETRDLIARENSGTFIRRESLKSRYYCVVAVIVGTGYGAGRRWGRSLSPSKPALRPIQPPNQ